MSEIIQNNIIRIKIMFLIFTKIINVYSIYWWTSWISFQAYIIIFLMFAFKLKRYYLKTCPYSRIMSIYGELKKFRVLYLCSVEVNLLFCFWTVIKNNITRIEVIILILVINFTSKKNFSFSIIYVIKNEL